MSDAEQESLPQFLYNIADDWTRDNIPGVYRFGEDCAARIREAADKLDYFATALPVDARFQAACAAIQSVSCGIIAQEKNRGSAAESLAESAVEIADALLSALAPPLKPTETE